MTGYLGYCDTLTEACFSFSVDQGLFDLNCYVQLYLLPKYIPLLSGLQGYKDNPVVVLSLAPFQKFFNLSWGKMT